MVSKLVYSFPKNHPCDRFYEVGLATFVCSQQKLFYGYVSDFFLEYSNWKSWFSTCQQTVKLHSLTSSPKRNSLTLNLTQFGRSISFLVARMRRPQAKQIKCGRINKHYGIDLHTGATLDIGLPDLQWTIPETNRTKGDKNMQVRPRCVQTTKSYHLLRGPWWYWLRKKFCQWCIRLITSKLTA